MFQMESKWVSTSSGKYTPLDFFINSALPKTLQKNQKIFNKLFDFVLKNKTTKKGNH